MCWDAARSPDLASTSKAPSHSGMEQWLCFLVRFTVTGIVRRSHPIPLTRAHLASRRATARLRLLIRLSRLLYLRRERMSMKEWEHEQLRVKVYNSFLCGGDFVPAGTTEGRSPSGGFAIALWKPSPDRPSNYMVSNAGRSRRLCQPP